MANNGASQFGIAAIPEFYGFGARSKDHLSAEQFVARVEALIADNSWDKKKSACMFASYLRADAFVWLEETLPALYDNDNGVQMRKILADYDLLKDLFVQRYFKVRSTADLPANWSDMKQMNEESAFAFAERLAAQVNKFTKLV